MRPLSTGVVGVFLGFRWQKISRMERVHRVSIHRPRRKNYRNPSQASTGGGAEGANCIVGRLIPSQMNRHR